jgi:hypothetical protein
VLGLFLLALPPALTAAHGFVVFHSPVEAETLHGRDLRQTVLGAVDNSSGPLFPVFIEDLPPGDNVTFAKPTQAVVPDTRAAFSPTPIPACVYAELPNCASNLTTCLLVDPVDSSAVCGCYLQRAQCLRTLGCYDVITRAELQYCFADLDCSMDACEGTSAVASLAVASVAAAAAVFATLVAVFPAG